MNAPTPFRYLPLEQIVPSPTNKRRIRQEKLQELADNIKANGVMQPILVRPIGKDGRALFNAGDDATPDHYEIVAGERRWRASQLAGENMIPAIVRELLDLDALQLQVFENLHRDDLHPMEEAEAFDQLLKKSQDLVGLSVDELALKVHKSRSYVYASLKLLDLCTYARDAFFDGKIGKETAVLVARIPGEKLQTRAVKEIIEGTIRTGYEPMSFRKAKDHVISNYTLSLSKAPFDTTDKELVPKAGNCTMCMKRSGNCPEDFPEIKSADVCTSPDCFAEKREAHIKRIAGEGKRVISGEAAEKIMPYVYSPDSLTGNYVDIDSTCHLIQTKEGEEPKTYRELLGEEKLPRVSLLARDDAKPIDVAKKDALRTALENAGYKFKPTQRQEHDDREEKAKAETEKRRHQFMQLGQEMYNRGLGDDDDMTRDILAKLVFDSFSSLPKDDKGPVIECFSRVSGPIGDIAVSIFMDDIKSMSIQRLTHLKILIDCYQEVEIYWWQGEKRNPSAEFLELLSPPPSAAQAVEQPREVDGVDEAPADAGQVPETPEPAAPADANVPPEFAEIKARALAKKARKDSKKVSAPADGNTEASTAPAVEETITPVKTTTKSKIKEASA
jgi:ParB/RepB/Spo0J family partition protein